MCISCILFSVANITGMVLQTSSMVRKFYSAHSSAMCRASCISLIWPGIELGKLFLLWPKWSLLTVSSVLFTPHETLNHFRCTKSLNRYERTKNHFHLPWSWALPYQHFTLVYACYTQWSHTIANKHTDTHTQDRQIQRTYTESWHGISLRSVWEQSSLFSENGKKNITTDGLHTDTTQKN